MCPSRSVVLSQAVEQKCLPNPLKVQYIFWEYRSLPASFLGKDAAAKPLYRKAAT